MTRIKEVFEGCEITIEDGKIAIDGMSIDVTQPEAGKYITRYLPYTAYETELELARAVVKHTPDFRPKP